MFLNVFDYIELITFFILLIKMKKKFIDIADFVVLRRDGDFM